MTAFPSHVARFLRCIAVGRGHSAHFGRQAGTMPTLSCWSGQKSGGDHFTWVASDEAFRGAHMIEACRNQQMVETSVFHSRRQFLLRILPALALAGCSVSPIKLPSELGESAKSEIPIGCSPLDVPGLERCGVGFSMAELKRINVATWQKMPQWCWAACIQMAFRFYGFEVPQERIVTAAYGKRLNLPAFSWQIHSQISRRWTDDFDRDFEVTSKTLIDVHNGLMGSDIGKIVHAELAEKRPLILGLAGHATLLVAHEAIQSSDNAYVLDIPRAMVIDPWPLRMDNNPFKMIHASEINMTQYLASIEVTPSLV
jgi:hypothetical protein